MRIAEKYTDGWFESRNWCYFGILEAVGISAATASAIGTAASVGGAVIGGLGAISQAQSQAASAKYSSQVAAENATIANQNAQWAGQSGEQQAAMSEQKTRAEVGSIQANQAASGINVNTGSAVDVRSSAVENGELDAITIRSNAARQAYGYQTQSTSDVAQSTLDKSQAGYDSTAGDISGASTLIGGIGSASNNYTKYLQAGGMSSNGS